MAAKRSPRRAPADAERRRDPERTRERILNAAVDEFGAHGYAGARTSRIAAAAGVNAQLITYHFDGKAGLYRAVTERWRTVTEMIPRPETPIAAIAAAFVRTNSENRNFARLLAWEALGDAPATADGNGIDEQDAGRAGFYRSIVTDLERRQANGELPADVSPSHLLLALVAIASAPVSLPHLARLITGEDPGSPEFQESYAAQVEVLVGHLAAPVVGR